MIRDWLSFLLFAGARREHRIVSPLLHTSIFFLSSSRILLSIAANAIRCSRKKKEGWKEKQICSYSKHKQVGFTVSLILYDLFISIFIPFLPFKFHFVQTSILHDGRSIFLSRLATYICIHLLYMSCNKFRHYPCSFCYWPMYLPIRKFK